MRYYDNASTVAATISPETPDERAMVLVANIMGSVTITDRRGREFILHRISYHLPPRFYMTYPDKCDMPVLSEGGEDDDYEEPYTVFNIDEDVIVEGEPATLVTHDGHTDHFVIRSLKVHPQPRTPHKWMRNGQRGYMKKQTGRPPHVQHS